MGHSAQKAERQTHLLLMMQTLVIILHHRQALLPARDIIRGRVHDVAGQEVLPEREAAGLACTVPRYISQSQSTTLIQSPRLEIPAPQGGTSLGGSGFVLKVGGA